jgi:superfamily II DNA or RNA helicase
MFTLRQYQHDCIHGNSQYPGILKAWQSNRHVLNVAATGTGKTVIFSALAKLLVSQGARFLILCHRSELLSQAKDKISRSTGLACAIEKAESSSVDCMEMITVGSVQSLINPDRRSKIHAPTHIIIDEAHHCLSDSWQSVLGQWPDAYVAGFTATPERGDMRQLGTYFDSLAFEYTLPEAILAGYLCKIRAQTIPLKLDMSAVKNDNGDLALSGIAKALEPYLPHISKEIAEHCQNRKCLIFAPLCATAQTIQSHLQKIGFPCFYVSGEDRSQAAAWEAHGPGCACVNAMLYVEGYDHPQIDAVCVLRPTKVNSLYQQMIGRGTRIHPGKDYLKILDFLWMSEKHSLCRPTNLISEDSDLALCATERMDADPGGEVELNLELIEQARSDLIEKREAALARKLAEMRHKKRQLVDPVQYAQSIGAPEIGEYKPTLGQDAKPPTPMQIERLAKEGIYPEEIQFSGHANAILNTIETRRANNLAQPRQVRCLERYGFKHVGQMEFKAAQKIITRIAANGWRLPPDMRGKI